MNRFSITIENLYIESREVALKAVLCPFRNRISCRRFILVRVITPNIIISIYVSSVSRMKEIDFKTFNILYIPF